MKKFLPVYIIAGIILLTGFLLYAGIRQIPPRPEVDVIAINEITQEAVKHWEALDRLGGMDFKYRFLIFGEDGDLIFSSDENLPESIQAALRLGFLPIDVANGTSVLGKALIETSPDSYIDQTRDRLSNAVLIAFALLCALAAAALFVLYTNIVRPFRRLEAFAHRISTGRFDEPLPIDNNNLFGPFTYSFDVMRASLLEARQKQLIAERAQKELIASLNHDIKTPITSIKLASELLQARSGLDEAVMEKLKMIDMKADQINRLMNDMLHSTLEELGELKVNPASRESGILAGLFKNADQLSKIRLGDIPPCLVELDLSRMEQVVGNIVTNSYKYAGTEIYVSFKTLEHFLQIEINDFGAGVDPEELELICTKFYRGENAKAAQKEGEGLGLYIAKQLMEKMDGELEAINRNDGFTIRLLVKLSK